VKPTLRILQNLARSGGTIISRCLASMDGVALLSEIHPTQRQVFSPTQQAREWYGLDVPYLEDFVESIRVLEEKFHARGQTLVIRTWNHVDFMPCQWNRQSPTMRPALCDQLREAFDLRRVAITREPGPMWESLTRFLADWDCCSYEAFLEGHRCFSKMANSVGRIEYETFCQTPHSAMLRMCRLLGLPYDATFIDKWQAYRNITGDVGSFDRTTIAPKETR
jgi:protein O-GlcNAc transferase